MTISTKIVRVFVFTFAGVFLPALANITDDVSKSMDWNAARAALIALFFAACAAAIRAIVAFLPVFTDDNAGIRRS